MNILRLLAILIAYLVLATHSSNSSANPEQEWLRGFNIQMPATSRTILLASNVDPNQWAKRMGLENYQVSELGTKGSILNLPMEQREWQRRQTQLCQAPDVQSCENTQCQQIQLGGRVRSGPGIQSFRPRLRLVKKAPDIAQLLDPKQSGDNYCPTDNSDFNLDTPVLNRPPRAVNFQLDPDQLPEDPQCWDLVVESACSKTVTPLESLVPAREIKRVLVLLPAANAGTVQTIATRYGLRVLRQIELTTLKEVLVVFEITGSGTVDSMLPRLLADGVSDAYPEQLFSASAEYGDPYAALAYGPKRIGAPKLHQSATGKGSLIAVIDTGMDQQHPELVDSIAEFQDLTGKGWSADLHGTAIAGIIAAKANNGVGSYGVAPDVKILGLKACQPKQTGKLSAHCWTSTLVQALDLAIEKNAKIINMSLGGPPDKLLARYVRAAQQRDRLIIGAAGNGGPHAKPAFPAALEEVIAVTAIDALDRSYAQANVGNFIELAAPGVDIISVSPGPDYPSLSGTSMAAAHVAGAAALLMQLNPSLSPQAIRQSMLGSVTDLGQAGPDDQFGSGVIDSCRAAEQITGDSATCSN